MRLEMFIGIQNEIHDCQSSGFFQMSPLKRILWWPSRSSLGIPVTISSRICSGTGCIYVCQYIYVCAYLPVPKEGKQQYLYVYVYICVYMYVYTHTEICNTWIYLCMHVYVCKHMYICMFACVCVCVRENVFLYRHLEGKCLLCVCMCMFVCVGESDHIWQVCREYLYEHVCLCVCLCVCERVCVPSPTSRREVSIVCVYVYVCVCVREWPHLESTS